MKKKLLLFVIVIALSNLHAQNKGYVALSFGGSSPLGDFADNNAANNNSGLAKFAASLDLSLGYKLGKNFGVAVLIKKQSFPCDSDALTKYYQANYGDIAGASVGNWNLTYIMVGGYGSFPIDKKWSFESKILLGAALATSPEISIKTTSNQTGSFASKSGNGLALLYNVGVKYDVGKKICLLFNLDYIDTKPTFTYTNSSGGQSTANQSIQSLSYTFGVGYRL